MVKQVIFVNGMSCAHCEGRVSAALSLIDGVKTVKANAKKNEVVVKYDENLVEIDLIKKKIVETGYEVV